MLKALKAMCNRSLKTRQFSSLTSTFLASNLSAVTVTMKQGFTRTQLGENVLPNKVELKHFD
jgi:hypothetical protein